MSTVDRAVFRAPSALATAMGRMPAKLQSKIRRVIRVELDDVEIAIKADNTSKALDELDNAVRKLKRIANGLQ
jgi:hypothetical protein